MLRKEEMILRDLAGCSAFFFLFGFAFLANTALVWGLSISICAKGNASDSYFWNSCWWEPPLCREVGVQPVWRQVVVCRQ